MAENALYSPRDICRSYNPTGSKSTAKASVYELFPVTEATYFTPDLLR